MNEDFSKLSYKELQALAAKNKIPGNIKKELLVDFLEALKSGNEVQVNRMLDELRENRKRKVRKRKLERLEKMTAVTSTPMHSPNYSSIDDRFYSPQHLSPYRWTVPEEEMIKREDPNYEMFRQYLIQRIQKNYQNFDTNNNDGELDTAALNLKAGPMEFSTHQSNVFTNPTEAKSFLPSPIFETQESHSLRNINENNTNNNNNNNNSYKPMILQKMLQAPLGTNLGAMARLEANRMWPIEHYRSLRDIDDNNSDTITADSESCDEEWNERECYNIFDNNRRSQTMFNEQNQIPQINLDQMMMNYLQNNSQNGYQINSTGNFIQENCQSWIDNSLDYRGPIDYTETADTSRIYPSYSVDEQVNNYQFQNDINITNFGQNVNSIVENNSMQIQNMHYYPLQQQQQPQQQQQQQQQQQIQQFRPECYEQNHSSVICNNSSFNVNVSNSYNPVHTQDSFGIYSQDPVTTSATYSGGENFHYQTQAAQKDRNNPIDMYWPKWSDNNASDLRLENILNLSTGGSTDYTKLNQTSSVYCFAPPLSCPLSGSSSSENVERAEFVTAGRCHTFISNSLVYSDSTTDYRSDDSFQPEPIQEVWITDFNNQDGNESNDYLSTSCETIPE